MPKLTTHDDDAIIYHQRKELTEKEKLQSMNFKQKISYLWDYYKLHALAVILVISIISYITYKIVTPNVETRLYTAVINNPFEVQEITKLEKDLAKYLHLNKKTEDVFFNTAFNYTGSQDNTLNMQTILTTYIAAQDVDIIIAPESEFKMYAYHGYFDKLSEQLPRDLYRSLADQLYLSSQKDDAKKNAYGIYINNSLLFQNIKTKDRYVLGFVGNSRHKDNAIKMVRYIFKSQK